MFALESNDLCLQDFLPLTSDNKPPKFSASARYTTERISFAYPQVKNDHLFLLKTLACKIIRSEVHFASLVKLSKETALSFSSMLSQLFQLISIESLGEKSRNKSDLTQYLTTTFPPYSFSSNSRIFSCKLFISGKQNVNNLSITKASILLPSHTGLSIPYRQSLSQFP